MGRITGNIDWLILGLLFFLSLTGIFLLSTTNPDLFLSQTIFLFVSLIFIVLLSYIDKTIYLLAAPISYIIAVSLLVLSYFGPAIRGSTRWIMIGGFQLQTSELAKPLLILFFSWLINKYPPRVFKYFLIHIALFILPFFLVYKQPDLGSSIIYLSFWLFMMLAGGLKLKILAGMVFLASFFIPVIWPLLKNYQKDRIITFLNPYHDPAGAGYNALQAMIAIGSGQLIGRGLGRGTQSHLRFLPEYHTDFIFGTLIEELGFMGGIILLILYFLLLWKIITKMKSNTLNIFNFSFSAGIFGMILSQTFINMGMNLGILPITGITLPLVSYGGSSLMSIFISFGIFMALL